MASAGTDASPTSLDQLPTEILREICMNLCGHCRPKKIGTNLSNPFENRSGSPRALFNLSRTSKRFRDIALPIFYHDAGQIMPFSTWLLDIFMEPKLAESVRVLQLGHIEWGDPGELQLAMDIAEDYDMDVYDDPCVDFALGNNIVFSHTCGQIYDEVMLALCPNVETIVLPICDADDDDEMESTTTLHHFAKRLQINGDSAKLHKLRHLTLTINMSDTFSICNPGVRVILRAAPALQTLVFVGTTWLSDHHAAGSFNSRAFTPALQNLTTLELINSIIPIDKEASEQDREDKGLRVLAEIICRAKKLKHFRYVTCRKADEREHLPAECLFRALQFRADTLETIEIGTNDISATDHEPFYPEMRVVKSTLAPFNKLRTLRLNEAAFCKHYDSESDIEDPELRQELCQSCIVNILPPSVKHLIVGLDAYTMAARTDLLMLAQMAPYGIFPNLESLHVIILYGPGETCVEQNTEGLRKAKKKSARLLPELENLIGEYPLKISIEPEGSIEPGQDDDEDSDDEWDCGGLDGESDDASGGHSDSDGGWDADGRSDDE
ncbi:hypothetical protein CEP54_014986 [Fusarium duplospermum]|uniref:F-box domain-containing protein n=1 Tax=Fusarium duplospermum TaxID=1325734 RepID=A0A428NSC2_9HYPO|nr:hypothetical protein CEP54_014986 [Fusarium duplospermum]